MININHNFLIYNLINKDACTPHFYKKAHKLVSTLYMSMWPPKNMSFSCPVLSFELFHFSYVFYVNKCFLVPTLPSEMVSEKLNGENGNKSFWLFSPSVQAQLLLTGKIAGCL